MLSECFTGQINCLNCKLKWFSLQFSLLFNKNFMIKVFFNDILN